MWSLPTNVFTFCYNLYPKLKSASKKVHFAPSARSTWIRRKLQLWLFPCSQPFNRQPTWEKSSSVTSFCTSAAALSQSKCWLSLRYGIWMCVLTTHWAEQDVLLQLGERLCLRVILIAWICCCECWSRAWWWERGQNFDKLPPFLPRVRHVFITQTWLNFCTWENSNLQQKVAEKIGDLITASI